MVDVTGIEKHDSLTETATWILTQNNTDTMNFTGPSALCFKVSPQFGSLVEERLNEDANSQESSIHSTSETTMSCEMSSETSDSLDSSNLSSIYGSTLSSEEMEESLL